MSKDEADLLRLRSWDNYAAAKSAYQTHKAKLAEWGKLFSGLGRRLSESPRSVAEQEGAAIPTNEQFQAALAEFRNVVTEFKRAWIAARDFGFPVDQDDLKEIGPL